MRKSGNITIRLGPKAVEDILTGKPGTFIGRHSIQSKVEKAVAETFADVAKDKAQEKLAYATYERFRCSSEYEEAMKPFIKEKRELWEKHRNESMDVSSRQGAIFQQMLQKLFNTIGITEFVATQWNFTSVTIAKERAEAQTARKKLVKNDSD